MRLDWVLRGLSLSLKILVLSDTLDAALNRLCSVTILYALWKHSAYCGRQCQLLRSVPLLLSFYFIL